MSICFTCKKPYQHMFATHVCPKGHKTYSCSPKCYRIFQESIRQRKSKEDLKKLDHKKLPKLKLDPAMIKLDEIQEVAINITPRAKK